MTNTNDSEILNSCNVLKDEVEKKIKSNYGLIYETTSNGNIKCDFAKSSSMCSSCDKIYNVEDAWNWLDGKFLLSLC